MHVIPIQIEEKTRPSSRTRTIGEKKTETKRRKKLEVPGMEFESGRLGFGDEGESSYGNGLIGIKCGEEERRFGAEESVCECQECGEVCLMMKTGLMNTNCIVIL